MPYSISEVYTENVAQELLRLHQANKLFSIVPIQLAQSEINKQEDKNNASTKLVHV
jgi:hypothetical protein